MPTSRQRNSDSWVPRTMVRTQRNLLTQYLPAAVGILLLSSTAITVVTCTRWSDDSGEVPAVRRQVEFIPATVSVPFTSMEPQSLSVALRNSTMETVTVVAVESPCGCVLIDSQWRRRMSPGSEQKLQLRLKSPGYSSRAVTLSADVRGRRAQRVTLPIELIAIPLKPPYIKTAPTGVISVPLPPARDAAEVEFELRCIEAPGSKPWLTGFEKGDLIREVAFEVTRTSPAGDNAVWRNYKCRAYVEPPFATPPSFDTVTWVRPETRSPCERGGVLIRLRVVREGAIIAIPSRVVVTPRDDAAEDRQRRIILLNRLRDPWRILQVTTSADWIDARIVGGASDDKHLKTVNVRFDPAAASIVKRPETIRIHTSLPRSRIVEIAVEVASGSPGDVAADSVLLPR